MRRPCADAVAGKGTRGPCADAVAPGVEKGEK